MEHERAIGLGVRSVFSVVESHEGGVGRGEEGGGGV